jgi:hypothetical protein
MQTAVNNEGKNNEGKPVETGEIASLPYLLVAANRSDFISFR